VEKKTKLAVEDKSPSMNLADATAPTSTSSPTRLSSNALAPDSSPVAADATSTSSNADLTAESVELVWKEALASLGDMTAESARHAGRVALAGPNRVVASFGPASIWHKESCERPERRTKLEAAMSQLTGRAIRIDFDLLSGSASPEAKAQPVVSTRQRWREREKHPLVRRAIEMFDAEVVRVEEPRVGS
jgi:hypothetical protein